MKKFITAILLLAFVCVYATNVNKPATKKHKNLYAMNVGDTLGINTGNSATLYQDTSRTLKQGFGAADFDGDTLSFLTWGYYDGDETSTQIKVDESPNAGLTWITVATDTLTVTAAGASRKQVSVTKNEGCEYRQVMTTYGTTDSMCVEGVLIFGK